MSKISKSQRKDFVSVDDSSCGDEMKCEGDSREAASEETISSSARETQGQQESISNGFTEAACIASEEPSTAGDDSCHASEDVDSERDASHPLREKQQISGRGRKRRRGYRLSARRKSPRKQKKHQVEDDEETLSMVVAKAEIKAEKMEFTCKICQAEFMTEEDFKHHQVNQKHFACPVCDKVFKRMWLLKSHAVAHSTDRPYTCDRCGKSFSRNSDVSRHRRTHNVDKSVPCDVCGKDFWQLNLMRRHKKRVHEAENHKKHPCPVCGKTYIHLSEMRRHHHIHTGERPFPCDKCGKSFTTKDILKRHLAIHSDSFPYPCPECSKSFHSSQRLKAHLVTHSDSKNFACEFCGHKFKQQNDLVVHRRIHTGEKPYICEICGRGFSRSLRLKEHIRVHTGERPYSCSVCSRRFVQIQHLKAHMITHTGARPYKCDFCEKAYTTKDIWRKHIKKQHPQIAEDPSMIDPLVISVGDAVPTASSEDSVQEITQESKPVSPITIDTLTSDVILVRTSLGLVAKKLKVDETVISETTECSYVHSEPKTVLVSLEYS